MLTTSVVMIVCHQESVCRSRSRAARPSAAFFLDEDELCAENQPARQRKCGGSKKKKHHGGKKRKGGKRKKKHERSRVRQPYINTCLSIPYVSSKFMH